MDIHPYYISKAEDVFGLMKFDDDADPMPLAAWAQGAERYEIVFCTSDGHIVGHGRYYHTMAGDVAYADDETTKRYRLIANEAGGARYQIGRQIGRPVVVVGASRFSGPATHRAQA
ncbi:hypothetical protein [Bifidobacterium vansinderenii]|uniref:Uncharacterized protein n=1 Tax=Bifidobacterium vansinderenii TaxID=1984871 RepID=A0A229W0U9_9BIFI|nr:hypothetical protein [Bifidobacterium vansinderenii]OXN01503.1 hypothetical protein Tam10B_0506 [Bifidobacterium vansinderenii]